MPNHNPVTEQRLSKMLDATEDQGLKSVYVGEGVVFNKNLIRQSGFNQAEQWLSVQLGLLQGTRKGTCVAATF